jgi:hypothetical protein
MIDRKRDCLAHVTNQLDKFKPDKGKAFSFFSVIVKNWFLMQVSSFKKTRREDISLDEIIANSLNDKGEANNYPSGASLEVSWQKREYFEHFLESYATWHLDFRDKTNLMAVYTCIGDLFHKDFVELDGFDRRAVYVYIQERTPLSNNQIANALYRLRKQYKEFSRNWYK